MVAVTTIEGTRGYEPEVLGDRPGPVGYIANEVSGANYWRSDRALRALVASHLPEEMFSHLEPYFDRLGALAGGRLDELARIADRKPPVLHPRDKFGRDEDWIEYDLSYREMERIAYVEYGLHAITHRGGVLGWPSELPASVKFALQYLFVQAEFGLMCPVNATDTSAYLIQLFGSGALKKYLLPRMLSQDPHVMWLGSQSMTEKAGGSDVGQNEATAEHVGVDENGLDCWRLNGDKWFCSHTDAEVVMILARPPNAGGGTKGLALFAMPRWLADGQRNSYRIVRLKEKLGTRSMASGELLLDGAIGYLVGELDRGFAQMMEQVSLCRISHGARAAAMMRRCLNEALVVAKSRTAFGEKIIEKPLLRRQLMKIMVPAEQALSMFMFAGRLMDAGDLASLRLVTPLLKFRACRDNIQVAAGALEVRGGNGYIEEFVNARLVRDAQIGTLWEGTSNVNALDAITRAVRKDRGHEALSSVLHGLLDTHTDIPINLRTELAYYLDRAIEFAVDVAAEPHEEQECRSATSGLYNAVTAVLLAVEGNDFGSTQGDARRMLMALLVIKHRLSASDPLKPRGSEAESHVIDLLLPQEKIPLPDVVQLIESSAIEWAHARVASTAA